MSSAVAAFRWPAQAAQLQILAIDPGHERSAAVVYDGRKILRTLYEPNERMLLALRNGWCPRGPMVIEKIESYGMAVGETVFSTCRWTGRFIEAWESHGLEVHLLPRRDVKLHLCGSSRAKDANVRQALIDRFGPSKREAIGIKKSPGPLYGFKGDLWAALGVAVTWCDQFNGGC